MTYKGLTSKKTKIEDKDKDSKDKLSNKAIKDKDQNTAIKHLKTLSLMLTATEDS
jgi:hypothetical protein